MVRITEVLAFGPHDRGSILKSQSVLTELISGYVVPHSLLDSFKAMKEKGLLATLNKLYHAIRIMYWTTCFGYRNDDATVRFRLLHFLEGVREEYPEMPVGAAGKA